MCQKNKIIFIHDPGVVGILVDIHPENAITAVYYLDGITYRVFLLEDEYDLRFGEIFEK